MTRVVNFQQTMDTLDYFVVLDRLTNWNVWNGRGANNNNMKTLMVIAMAMMAMTKNSSSLPNLTNEPSLNLSRHPPLHRLRRQGTTLRNHLPQNWASPFPRPHSQALHLHYHRHAPHHTFPQETPLPRVRRGAYL